MLFLIPQTGHFSLPSQSLEFTEREVLPISSALYNVALHTYTVDKVCSPYAETAVIIGT